MTKPKISWPQTPADVRRFLASNCECIILGDENGDPNENDQYGLSAHDLLSAFSEWVDFGREPERQPQQEPINKYCCHSCFNESGQVLLDRMILCPECGNKRCPKASHHNLPCTTPLEPQPQQEPVANEGRCPECGYLTQQTEHIGCLRKTLNVINACEQRKFAIVDMETSQPQQEPVAWWNKTKDTVSADPVHRHNSDCQPLYATTPQRQPLTSSKCATIDHIEDVLGMVKDSPSAQRKPLTDEQIWDICCKTSGLDFYLNFARAIEAAHGIK